jgi:hypothetical protein
VCTNNFPYPVLIVHVGVGRQSAHCRGVRSCLSSTGAQNGTNRRPCQTVYSTFLNALTSESRSQSMTVGIVTALRAELCWVRIPVEARDFSLFIKRPEQLRGPPSLRCNRYWWFFPEVKWTHFHQEPLLRLSVAKLPFCGRGKLHICNTYCLNQYRCTEMYLRDSSS